MPQFFHLQNGESNRSQLIRTRQEEQRQQYYIFYCGVLKTGDGSFYHYRKHKMEVPFLIQDFAQVTSSLVVTLLQSNLIRDRLAWILQKKVPIESVRTEHSV